MKPLSFSACVAINRSSISINLTVACLIVFFSALTERFFSTLSLDRTQAEQGELWRLFTSNFVHFGWPHTLINLSAFSLCALALLNSFPARQLLGLIGFCCLSVGLGVYYFNPEYGTYAGLSGAIHGFIVAGLMRNKRHPNWLNAIFIALVFAKIIYEHQPDYQATHLQTLMPVPVAYDAHMYGAIAGVVFGLSHWLINWTKRKP
ncbi:MAG TPA: rhombosortase [Cellvibrio sp.]|nr:rhombosortase [Cellvibrio sp.]